MVHRLIRIIFVLRLSIATQCWAFLSVTFRYKYHRTLWLSGFFLKSILIQINFTNIKHILNVMKWSKTTVFIVNTNLDFRFILVEIIICMLDNYCILHSCIVAQEYLINLPVGLPFVIFICALCLKHYSFA